MRDILISSAVCVACLVLALVSQLVNPTTVAAAPAPEAMEAASAAPSRPAPVAKAPAAAPNNGRARFELDLPDSGGLSSARGVCEDSA